jgi:hypothetical protein
LARANVQNVLAIRLVVEQVEAERRASPYDTAFSEGSGSLSVNYCAKDAERHRVNAQLIELWDAKLERQAKCERITKAKRAKIHAVGGTQPGSARKRALV